MLPEMEYCVCAIDPGLTGALAFFFPSAPDRVSVEDMPVLDGEVNVTRLIGRIRQMGASLAVVERVNAMPGGGDRKMGATSAFNFGAAFSAAKACVTACEIPLHLVTPAVWKKSYGLAGGKEGKEAARGLASRLFPAVADRFVLKKSHGLAEAALLARYGAERFLWREEAA